MLRRKVYTQGDTAFIVFEPGDGTRYNFSIVRVASDSAQCAVTGRRAVLFGISTDGGSTWKMFPANPGQYMTGQYAEEKLQTRTRFTAAVAAWFFNTYVLSLIDDMKNANYKMFEGEAVPYDLTYNEATVDSLNRFLEENLGVHDKIDPKRALRHEN